MSFDEEGMIDDAGLYTGPCPNCSSQFHKRLSFTERECWNCFSVFIVAQPIPDAPSGRVLTVVEYVQEHMACVDLAQVPKAEWDFAPGVELDPLGTYAIFGYLPPRVEADPWEWTYCPEVIAEQGAGMSDVQFDFYLSSIDVRVSMGWVRPELSPAERERQIDDLLHMAAPEVSKVVTALQLRVLDAKQRSLRNGN